MAATTPPVILEQVIPPKTGLAIETDAGQLLQVTDLEDSQVVDMALFNAKNHREKLSTSYSRTRYVPQPGETYKPRDHLTVKNVLRSTLCEPMMTIVEETPAVKSIHDVHNRMCNTFLYEQFGFGSRDGCHEIISKAVAEYGRQPEDIPDTIDLFMNFHHDCELGQWVTEKPVSKAGDYIEFRLEMDLLIGFSNCPLDVMNPCNGYRCTPVKIAVFGG